MSDQDDLMELSKMLTDLGKSMISLGNYMQALGKTESYELRAKELWSTADQVKQWALEVEADALGIEL